MTVSMIVIFAAMVTGVRRVCMVRMRCRLMEVIMMKHVGRIFWRE